MCLYSVRGSKPSEDVTYDVDFRQMRRTERRSGAQKRVKWGPVPQRKSQQSGGRTQYQWDAWWNSLDFEFVFCLDLRRFVRICRVCRAQEPKELKNGHWADFEDPWNCQHFHSWELQLWEHQSTVLNMQDHTCMYVSK